MWTEHVPNDAVLDAKVFPRMLAMSEVLWNAPVERNFDKFANRVQHQYKILEKYDVKYGEEAVPFTWKMNLKNGNAFFELIPYNDKIELAYTTTPTLPNNTKYKTEILINEPVSIEVKPTTNKIVNSKDYIYKFNPNKATAKSIAYQHPFSDFYTAGGKNALIDAKLGSKDFRDGSWQGYWGTDAAFTLDLGKEESFSNVGAEFYQYNNSWIFMPQQIEVEISNDGKRWQKIGIANPKEVQPKDRGKFIETISVSKKQPISARYLKLKVKNFGKVPDWHEAAGSDAWIFISEIIVE